MSLLRLIPEDEDEKTKDVEPLNLTGASLAPIPLAPGTSLNRAQMFDFALGEDSPGLVELEDSVKSSNIVNEGTRKKVMAMKFRKERQQRQEILRQYAQDQGGVMNSEQYSQLLNLSDESFGQFTQDPATFFEREYGKKVINTTQEKTAQPALTENEELAHTVLDVGQGIITQRFLAQQHTEAVESRLKRESGLAQAFHYAEEWIPFVNWAAVGTSGMDIPRSSILKGSIASEQYQYLMRIQDPQTFNAAFTKIVDEMYEKSPHEAIRFAQGFMNYTASQQFLDNAFSVLDVASVVPVAGATRIAKALTTGPKVKALATSLKDTIKSTSGRTFRPAELNIIAGNADKTAFDIAGDKVLKKDLVTHTVDDVEEMYGELTATFNLRAALSTDATTLTAEHTLRLIAELEESGQRLFSTVSDPLLIGRLPEEKRALAQTLAEEKALEQYSHIADSFLGFRGIPAEKTNPGVDLLELQFGTKQGGMFRSPASATRAALKEMKLPANAFTVKSHGADQFYVAIKKPISEVEGPVRDLAIPTANQTPRTLKTLMLGYIWGPANFLPSDTIKAYLKASYGSSAFHEEIKQAAKAVTSLPGGGIWKKDSKRMFNQYTEMEQRAQYYAKSQGEFEQNWLHLHDTLPDLKETKAYWTYRQLNDYGYMVYNHSLLRDKWRMGMERFSLSWVDPAWKMDLNDPAKARYLPGDAWKPVSTSAPVEGKFLGGLDSIPWDNKDKTSFLIWGRTGEDRRLVQRQFASPQKLKEELTEEEGWKVIQVSPEGKRVLRDEPGLGSTLPKGDFDYIITREFTTHPMSLKQIPYKPGGMVDYPSGYFVSQPSVTAIKDGNYQTHEYKGDLNLFNFRSQKEATQSVKDVNTARQMYIDALRQENPDFAALQSFLDRNLPHEWGLERFQKLWRSEANPDGMLDLNTPVYLRDRGSSVESMYKISDQYTNFRDVRKSSHNLYNNGINLRHALERDGPLYTYNKSGDATSPVIKLEVAEILDPITTINRTTNMLMRGRYVEDLKFKLSEQFIAEFSDVLEMPLAQLRLNPVKALMEGKYRAGASREAVAAAKVFRRTAINFLGLKNDFQKSTRWVKEKLAQGIYNKAGRKAFDIVEPYLLTQTKDVPTVLRSVAFHTYLGMFNPLQFFVQAQSITHVAAIEGLGRAYHGMTAASFMRPLIINNSPEMVEAMAQRASKMGGWTADEFKEMWKGVQDSGFWNVGLEHAYRASLWDGKAAGGAGFNALDWSTVFFKEGERMPRLVAWGAAYKRIKAANPNRKLSASQWDEVLERADLLTNNMSLATRAGWNTGFAGVPTQFFNYQARMWEQFLGHRLTRTEKARAFLTYSAMYGVPVSAGAAFGVWPWADSLRQTLMENGIDYNDSVVSKTLMDGIPSMMYEMVTGDQMSLDRWGPKGLTFAREIYHGDKGVIETLLGASGTSLGNMWASMEPMTMVAVEALNGNGSLMVEVGVDTVNDFLKSISAYNNGTQAYFAMKTGMLVTRNGIPIDEISTHNALIRALMGISTRSTDDTFLMLQSNRVANQAKEKANQAIIKLYRKAWNIQKDDPAGAAGLFKMIQLYSEVLSPEEKVEVLSRAANNNTLFLSVGKSFSKQSPEQQQMFLNMLKRKEK